MTSVSKRMRVRIFKEIELLYDEYNNICIRYNKETMSQDFTILDKFKISINEDFPFTPPEKIVINDILWHEFIYIPSRFKELLHSKHKDKCFCCNTITKPLNWSPMYNLRDVFNELILYKKIKKQVFCTYIIDTIKKNYNVPNEIEIVEFLV